MFDMKQEAPIPDVFKPLSQGRIVRYCYADALTRPAIITEVLDQSRGIIEIEVFTGPNLPQIQIISEDGRAGAVAYSDKMVAGTWHWPPR
jgi:hypothetical protein